MSETPYTIPPDAVLQSREMSVPLYGPTLVRLTISSETLPVRPEPGTEISDLGFSLGDRPWYVLSFAITHRADAIPGFRYETEYELTDNALPEALPVLVSTPGPAVPIHGPIGPYPYAAEMDAFERRFGDALRAAGVDTDEYVALDSPGGKACLDGRFAAAELRTIADVMDALAKEPR